MDKNLKPFLNELSELCNKYKIRIGGCGCCSSPYLDWVDVQEGRYETDETGGDLTWKETVLRAD